MKRGSALVAGGSVHRKRGSARWTGASARWQEAAHAHFAPWRMPLPRLAGALRVQKVQKVQQFLVSVVRARIVRQAMCVGGSPPYGLLVSILSTDC